MKPNPLSTRNVRILPVTIRLLRPSLPRIVLFAIRQTMAADYRLLPSSLNVGDVCCQAAIVAAEHQVIASSCSRGAPARGQLIPAGGVDTRLRVRRAARPRV